MTALAIHAAGGGLVALPLLILMAFVAPRRRP